MDKLFSSLGLSVLIYKIGIATSVLLKLIKLNGVIAATTLGLGHVTDTAESSLISDKIFK